MAFSLRGVHVPHRKNTQNTPVAHMDPPATVTLPMSMHIGSPATPVVQVGDTVRVGTKIGECSGFVSVPVYSSVSGKVVKIRDFLLAGGDTTQAVVIESDGEMTPDASVCPPTVDSRDSFIAAVRDSGVVGLGGAGFPTHVKLNVEPERIEHLIINGAECEPYVTSDTVTMTDRREDMAYALEAMKTHLGIKHIIIGIESNKPQAIASMKELMKDVCEGCKVEVKVRPPR